MANSLYAFTGRVPNGEQSRSRSPLWRAPGEPAPKGVASDRFLTPDTMTGDKRGIQLPPSASRSDHEQERLRLQVIEILQLTLSGCDRDAIAEQAGLSMRQIGAWTSPSSGKNISLANTVQIVRATKRPDLLAWACEAAGYHLATTEDQQLAEVGRLYLEAEKRRARLRELVEAA